jgi:hypothetical protein
VPAPHAHPQGIHPVDDRRVNKVSAWLTMRPPTTVSPSWATQLGAGAGRQRQRQSSGQCRHGRHHGPETDTCLIDCVQRRFPFPAFGVERARRSWYTSHQVQALAPCIVSRYKSKGPDRRLWIESKCHSRHTKRLSRFCQPEVARSSHLLWLDGKARQARQLAIFRCGGLTEAGKFALSPM